MKYNMILLTIFFDKLMLQYIYCVGKRSSYYRKKPAEKKNKKLLRSVTNSRLKNNILKSARRATSAY